MTDKKAKSDASPALKDGRSNGRTAAGSALSQSPTPRSEHSSKSHRSQPTADELGLRAWKTTYENKHTKK
jgi:hypothetical protein